MITRLRRSIALVVAVFVTVLTLGRMKVAWTGVAPVADSGDERGAVTSVEGQ
jgi:hypothetical protein